VYYYVVVRGADGLTTVSGAAAVTVVNPEALILSNGKAAEGGAYGLMEPFRHRVMAVAGGETRDISASLGPGDFIYNFSTAALAATVTLAPSSSLSGVPCSSVSVTVKTMQNRVAWANGQGGAHTLLLYANESMPGDLININNAAITIKSGDESGAGMRTLSLDSAGIMFSVYGAGVKLILGRNITLQGFSPNNNSLVYVVSSGELVMEEGSVITGNTNTSSPSFGGGVYVSSGTFTMEEGSAITGNTTETGGGVYMSSGTFTMNGGTISGNTATNGQGGGVFMYDGTFNMGGSASVSGNTATGTVVATYGGGVYVNGSGASFSMGGSASVSGNTVTGTNTDGGGVYMSSGTFTMNGGTISGNAATGTDADGGGVSVYGGTFTLTQGTVYGTDAASALQNTATYGAALKWSGGTAVGGPLSTIFATIEDLTIAY
jgi:hypothetical protein